MNRRGFLKIAGVTTGGILLAQYDFVTEKAVKRRWITDAGDYYIVNVPERKSFGRENFDKPVLLRMDNGSEVIDITVDGFMNIVAKNGCSISNFIVDASKCNGRKEGVILESKYLRMEEGKIIPPQVDGSIGLKIVGPDTYILEPPRLNAFKITS